MPLDLLPSWLTADGLFELLGPWALIGFATIIFTECGLFIGLFFPGDSLLFLAGMLGTVINAMAFQDILEREGLDTRVMTAIRMEELAESVKEAAAAPKQITVIRDKTGRVAGATTRMQ